MSDDPAKYELQNILADMEDSINVYMFSYEDVQHSDWLLITKFVMWFGKFRQFGARNPDYNELFN